jgi:hypothetical protein
VSKDHPYVLHWIVIHEGEDNSGHYYSYIKNHIEGIWYKYDDHRVSGVTEEQVLGEAYGITKLKTSAYLVMYVSQKTIAEASKQKTEFDYYLSLIPKLLINQVNQENIRFSELIQESKNKEVAVEIMEHFKLLDNTLKKKMAGISDRGLISFPIFWFKNHETVICQHVILNTAIQEKHPAKLSIDWMDQTLENTLLKAFSYDIMYLTDQRKRNLELLKTSYYTNIEFSYIIKYVLENLLVDQYNKVFGVAMYLSTYTSNHEYMDKILRQKKDLMLKYIQVYGVYIISRSNHDLVNGEFIDAITKISLVTVIALNFVPMSSYLFENMTKLLSKIYEMTQEHMGEQAKNYKKVISAMEKKLLTKNHSVGPKLHKELKKKLEEVKNVELLR